MSRLRPRHVVVANVAVLVVAMLGIVGREAPASTHAPAVSPSPGAGPVTDRPVLSEEDVVYVRRAGAPLMLDWYAPSPASDLRPAVVFVHGGGWEAGSRQHFRRAARTAAEQGFIGITIDYRPAPATTFPGQPEDVAAALAWVHEQADSLAIDPHRIVLAGSSAGANLAALVATWDREATHPPVAAVIAWSGLYDLVWAASAATDADEGDWRAMFESYLGCSLDDPACQQRYEDASPAAHVDASDPPMLLLHGERELVPVEDAEAYQQQRDAAGLRTELRVYDTDAHGRALVARSLSAVTSFLESVRRPEGT